MRIHLPYGKETRSIDIPERQILGILKPPQVERLLDEEEVIRAALENPIGTARLRSIARGKRRIAIIVSDASRPNIERKVLPLLLEELRETGIRPEDVTCVIGTGAHRAATQAEIIDRLGPELARRTNVIIHSCTAGPLVNLGHTSQGYPIHVNEAVVQAEVKVAVGVVLPHPIAGYSGGGKGLLIGVGGAETITSTHTPEILEHPGTGLGMIDKNPFYQAALEAARMLPLDFIVNAVVDERGKIIDITSGDVSLAHRALIERTADRAFKVPFPAPADIVIVAPGPPKDSNLYHAIAEGVCVVAGDALPVSCVKKGGTVILVAPMEEGIYNESLYLYLADRGPAAVVERARREGVSEPGEHRAFGVAKVLLDAEVVVAEPCMDPNIFPSIHMRSFPSLEEAFRYARNKHGPDYRVLAFAYSHRLIPILQGRG